MEQPFRYEIRNQEIALELEKQGFTIHDAFDNCWTMQAPANISSTKARKIISVIIKLYSTAKELNRANMRYNNLASQLEQLTS